MCRHRRALGRAAPRPRQLERSRRPPYRRQAAGKRRDVPQVRDDGAATGCAGPWQNAVDDDLARVGGDGQGGDGERLGVDGGTAHHGDAAHVADASAVEVDVPRESRVAERPRQRPFHRDGVGIALADHTRERHSEALQLRQGRGRTAGLQRDGARERRARQMLGVRDDFGVERPEREAIERLAVADPPAAGAPIGRQGPGGGGLGRHGDGGRLELALGRGRRGQPPRPHQQGRTGEVRARKFNVGQRHQAGDDGAVNVPPPGVQFAPAHRAERKSSAALELALRRGERHRVEHQAVDRYQSRGVERSTLQRRPAEIRRLCRDGGFGPLQRSTDLALQRDRPLPPWSALPPTPELVEPALCVVAQVELAVAAQPQVALGTQVRDR